MAIQFTKATKYESKLRLALIGPAGSGKTYTALEIGGHLVDNAKIALMDTEHGSASKYADLFEFDVVAPDSFSPTVYMDVIKAAEQGGYDVLILDSLSHAWAGKGGILEFVDQQTARSRSHNAFSEGWRKASPLHNQLIDAILAADLHIIVTMRSKMSYEIVENAKGQKVPRKIGLQPVQRDGMEYEFDVIGDLDQDNNFVVGKTRCPALAEQTFPKAGRDVADVLRGWLAGEKPPEQPKPEQQQKQAQAEPEPQPTNGNTPQRPYQPDILKRGLETAAAKKGTNGDPASQQQIGLVAGKLNECFAGNDDADNKRRSIIKYVWGIDSSKDLTKSQAGAMLDWLIDEADESGDYPLKEMAVKEAGLIVRKVVEDAGQAVMDLNAMVG